MLRDSGPCIRVVCKLRSGDSDVEALFRALEAGEWKLAGPKLSKGEFEAEILSSSLEGDEVIFSLRSANPEVLEDFSRAAIRECWYIEVHYHLRAEAAEKAAENLGIKLGEKRVFRIKEFGVQLKVESFPAARALTISYRVGWGELNRNVMKKIHEKLINTKSPKSLLDRIMGWMK
ncbi:MAG: hypothetical protein N3F65_01520 [Nitrososphaeria archaeon]|nr:hypothetical protein [Aigarchaeota archaeon]MCX8187273.1 hypothetical protein [Nitrososphaeria archaeon]MDW8021009.1 hypothetical protein [Nitrososphaerota archaeon]